MLNIKAYLQALLARFVGKNSADTQFVGNLDWNRAINLSNTFVKDSIDYRSDYTTPESGVCVLILNEIVEGLFITDRTQSVNMMCTNSTEIWPSISCVVAKGRQVRFSIRNSSLPAGTQAVFVPFARAS